MGNFRCQVVIVGAGIAGLWALRRLLDLGWDAILLEREALGCRQTLAAQGILHSGVKYGLDGSQRAIAELLRTQPPIWLDSMARRGEVDLTSAKVLSPLQHLWAGGGWFAKAAAAIGARALQGEVREIAREAWPVALREGGHSGRVYQVEETVVDTRSVVSALANGFANRIRRGEITGFETAADGLRALQVQAEPDGPSARMAADAFIFTAGTGNEQAAAAFGLPPTTTQRRPLKMILARGPLPPLWGHAVSASPKPRATITTHDLQGEPVYYIGGQVAESAAAMDDVTAIAHAKSEMAGLFPGLDWSGVRWSTYAVDRAEPSQSSGHLPDGPALLPWHNAAITWPTKLVYAPALSEKILAFVQDKATRPAAGGHDVGELALPEAQPGLYPWESGRSWTN